MKEGVAVLDAVPLIINHASRTLGIMEASCGIVQRFWVRWGQQEFVHLAGAGRSDAADHTEPRVTFTA